MPRTWRNCDTFCGGGRFLNFLHFFWIWADTLLSDNVSKVADFGLANLAFFLV